MKKITNLFPSFSIFCLLVLLVTSGCVKQDFDTPPANGEDPDIPASSIISIKDLKDMHQFGTINQLESDKYITGLVTANDESGNFFQTIVMEDETAGILVLIEQSGLSNFYPVGRRLFVRLDDLYLSDFNGLVQLAGQVSDTDGDGVNDRVDGIEDALVDEIVLRGQFGLEVIPTVVTIGELNDDRIGSLIQLEGVQFIDSDTGETYADAAGQRSVNRNIETCDGGSIILRSSGFANFANRLTPEGNGTITAVYTVFGATKQLIIRDTGDVVFEGARCGGGTPGGDEISIGDLRALYSGTAINAPSGRKIIGTVISDRANGNIDSRNLIVQNGGRGITVRFQDEHNYDLNDVLEVSTSGSELSDFNGLVQLNNVPNGNATKTGTGSITPNTITIADFISQSSELEGTLLEIENVLMTKDGEADYVFDVQLNDGTGTLDMFTSPGASFANDIFPTNTVSVTGIAGNFDGIQLNIRNLDDVVGGSTGGPLPGDLVSIESVLDMYNGTPFTAADSKIKGTVISDFVNGNTKGLNVVIQDGDRGIVVRFDSNHSFGLGDEIEVVISGLEVSDYNGLVQVSGVPLGNATVTGSNTISPMTVTVAEFLAQSDLLESVLLQFEDVTLVGDGGTTFNGNVSVSDASGTVGMFTRGAASFSGASLPTMATDLIAVGSQFNDPQIFIRNLDDVGETIVNPPAGDVDEDFENSVSPNVDANITGWDNIATQGSRVWRGRESDGNLYVQATAFNDSAPDMETWLITPGFDLTGGKTLTFESAHSFYVHDGLTVWIATNYDGTNATTANWTQLNGNIAQGSDPGDIFVPSGAVDLSGFSGTGHIGFRYQGSGSANTTSWRVDNIRVE